MANKVIAITSVKNDADIVESTIRHALQFADEVFVQDQASIDDTPKILKSLCDEKLPIKIVDKDIDGLIKDAINSQGKIIIPMQVNEFLIEANKKGAAELKRFLQNLNPNQIYCVTRTQCRFAEPDRDQDRFALARSVVHSKNINSNSQMLIIGADAWKDLNFYKAMQLKSHIFILGLYSFYFDERSALQKKFHDFVSQIEHEMMNKNQPAAANSESKDISDPISADAELACYREECQLKYTPKAVDLLQNVFQFALSVARSKKVESTPSPAPKPAPSPAPKPAPSPAPKPAPSPASKPAPSPASKPAPEPPKVVRVFVLHTGDATKTVKSIDSVRAQNYPHKEISVVMLNLSGIESVFDAEKKSLAELKFIDFESCAKVFENGKDFVQFVTAGDVLKPNRLSRMIELSNENKDCDVLFSESTIPEKNFLADYLKIVYTKKAGQKIGVASCSGIEFFTKILETGFAVPAGVTRAFFKQNFFNGQKWIDAWLVNRNAESRQMVLWNAMLNSKLQFFDEILVESGAEDWSIANLNAYLSLWINQLNHFKNTHFLAESQFEKGRQKFDSVIAKAKKR